MKATCWILLSLSSLTAFATPLLSLTLGLNFKFRSWGLTSLLIVSVTMIAVGLDWKSQLNSSREVALVIALGSLTAVSRLPFVLLPNVQPCTFLIVCAGMVFGSSAGFLVGILTPLISNLFLGHGPWTPYQMYAWGMVGGVSGLLSPRMNRVLLGVVGILFAYFYGFIMNIWFWYSFLYPLNLSTFAMAEIQGIYFDTFHAIGNFAFLTILGSRVLRILETFKREAY